MTDGDVKAGYVVLRRGETDDVRLPAGETEVVVWEQVATVEAPTPQAAIKAATDSEGVFVAVPARSFKPVTRKRKQITQDVWE